MYALIYNYGGVYDSGKLSNDLEGLIEEAKETYSNGFYPDYNQCVIIDVNGNILFSYEHDVYDNQ